MLFVTLHEVHTVLTSTVRKDTWSFPGGGLDPDETPEQCVIREVREELAVDVNIQPIGDEPVWGMTDDNVDQKLWRCSLFIVKQSVPEQVVKVG